MNNLETEDKKQKSFLMMVLGIALPVAAQSMLQSSFSVIDQLMISHLGSVGITAIGLAGKYTGIYSVVVGAVGTVAGIMISQNLGAEKRRAASDSLDLNMAVAGLVAVIMTLVSFLGAEKIMGIYLDGEPATVQTAAGYLKIVALAFIPMGVSTMSAVMLRCMDKANLAFVAGLISTLVNTALNYVLIYGKLGCPALGVKGAAIATLCSAVVNASILVIPVIIMRRDMRAEAGPRLGRTGKMYLVMLLPILFNEFMWSLGENVYAFIYGHLGTIPCAGMTLTNALQGLFIGALSGIAAAAGIIVGKELGKGDMDQAYEHAKRLIRITIIGSVILAAVVVLIRDLYVNIFAVEQITKDICKDILLIYALIAPFKVLNMVVAGGILRSGGDTKLVLYIDMIGTWCFGVPLGLLASFVFKQPIHIVYGILSLEEIIRVIITFVLFYQKKWMHTLECTSTEVQG